MTQPIEVAVDTYVRAWNERDRAVRQMMIDECFAADGRFVTQSKEYKGRAALEELMTKMIAEPEYLGVRLTSVIDARGTAFRFRAVADTRNGVSLEQLEVGEVNSKGRISLILTFTGPLADA